MSNGREYQECPLCAETIVKGAIICKHCKSEITQGQLIMNPDETDEEIIIDQATSDANEDSTFEAVSNNASIKKDVEMGANAISQLDTSKKVIDEEDPANLNLKYGAIGSYVMALIFLSIGFYKMFAYNNPESIYETHINAYVGGDAYNYIINANYATAYFSLAIFFAVIGMTCLLAFYIRDGLKKYN